MSIGIVIKPGTIMDYESITENSKAISREAIIKVFRVMRNNYKRFYDWYKVERSKACMQ